MVDGRAMARPLGMLFVGAGLLALVWTLLPQPPEALPWAVAIVGAIAVMAGALLLSGRLDREGPRTFDIALALSEACGNVVVHAYQPDDPHPTVRIAARTTGTSLVMEVEDRGRGLGSHHSDPGLGLGLGLIRRLADDARIEGRAGGGTSISMTFRLSPASVEPARYA